VKKANAKICLLTREKSPKTNTGAREGFSSEPTVIKYNVYRQMPPPPGRGIRPAFASAHLIIIHTTTTTKKYTVKEKQTRQTNYGSYIVRKRSEKIKIKIEVDDLDRLALCR
jgi:hypothetical protein